MDQINDLLTLQIGKSLAEGNWESHVHELGNDWVYKEIKQPRAVDHTVDSYEARLLLQEFWNSEIHFQNMVHDYEIFKLKLGSFIPETLFLRNTSLIDQSLIVNICVQEKLSGTLLKDLHHNPPKLQELAKSLRGLCEQVFKAPADFHPGNLLVDAKGRLFFFDTGTPSDWEYFLNPEKLHEVLGGTLDQASLLTEFMQPIYDNHWQKITESA